MGKINVIVTRCVYDRYLQRIERKRFRLTPYWDGCDKLLTEALMTSRGGIRDWAFARDESIYRPSLDCAQERFIF